MKRLTYLITLVCMVLAISACHDQRKNKNYNQGTQLDDQGVKFVTAAHEAGLTEINAANIAEKNSKNQRVINFAKMMMNDHTTAGAELDTIASKNLVLVTDTLTQAHKLMLAGISEKTGVTFDKAYMQMMVDDHNKVIDMFHYANKNSNTSLHNFAAKTLPTLTMHLDSAKAILASLK